jgi:hypothetical protein
MGSVIRDTSARIAFLSRSHECNGALRDTEGKIIDEKCETYL